MSIGIVSKRVRIYVPHSSDVDYYIDQATVSIALELGATHIVYEQWITGASFASESYALSNNISIQTVGEFLNKIDKGEYP